MWIKTNEGLPHHDQRVLGFVPSNKVFLPGKTGEFELRQVIVLKFQKDFYPEGSERKEKYGPHFWTGEGNSNHFFNEVTHWMAMPLAPL